MEQKCIFKSSIWRVFEVFVDEPIKTHFIKEISREINLSPTSIKKYIEDMEKSQIIIKKKGDRFFGYIANRENTDFLFYKKLFNLLKIKESGLIKHITEHLYPKVIILYGSYLRGEDIKESDIDLFIQSGKKKELNLERFEKILKRKIHIMTESGLKKLSKNLYSEIINGLVLYGYIKNE